MKIEPTLTIVVLCRNRPVYAQQALESIFAQSRQPNSIIVSDNSSPVFGEKLRYLLCADRVSYFRQSGKLSAREHMVVASKLVQTDLFMLLHDDDILCRDYVSSMVLCVKVYPDAIAYACRNSWIDSDGKNVRTFFPWSRYIREIKAAEDMIACYLSPSFGGAPAFSSYIYRRNLIDFGGAMPTTHTEFYDTIFLSHLVQHSNRPVIFSPKTLFKVRLHERRVTSHCGVRDYKPFYNWARLNLSVSIYLKSLESYRIANFKQALMGRGFKRRSFRLKVASHKIFICLITNREFRVRLLVSLVNFVNRLISLQVLLLWGRGARVEKEV